MSSAKTTDRFGFGKNWNDYLPLVDDFRISRAKDSITSFFGVDSLQGKTFVDIGSGSGLFSYAAFLLGAKRIVSFDYDPLSVAATQKLWEKAGKPAHWKVERGSALDADYLRSLGLFDIVYSWGVLHHTGSMWEAIEKTATMVAPGGQYLIAIYNRVDGRFGSKFWLSVKKRYNRGSVVTKKFIEWMYFFVYFIVAPLLRLRSPLAQMRNYRQKRGMDYYRDIVDWVGGYPYEYASVEEIFTFLKKKQPSFVLENVKTVGSIGNNWFLFRRTGTN